MNKNQLKLREKHFVKAVSGLQLFSPLAVVHIRFYVRT